MLFIAAVIMSGHYDCVTEHAATFAHEHLGGVVTVTQRVGCDHPLHAGAVGVIGQQYHLFAWEEGGVRVKL